MGWRLGVEQVVAVTLQQLAHLVRVSVNVRVRVRCRVRVRVSVRVRVRFRVRVRVSCSSARTELRGASCAAPAQG